MAKGYVGIPMSYTPVEYIQSSGTQYIDTGIIPSNTFKIETEIARIGLTANDGVCGSNVNSVWGMYLYLASNGKIACAYGNQNVYVVDNTNFADTNKHKYVLDLKSTGLETTVDGTLQSTKPYSAISNGANYYLFKCNDGGSSRVSSVKMYSFKIYDNNVLVRDFVPTLDENNVACLYDLVEGKSYYNAGTGTFTAGNSTGADDIVVEKARKIKKGYAGINNVARKIKKGYVGVTTTLYTPLDYIESSGTQYIDTGVHPSTDIQCVLDFQVTDLSVGNVITGGWLSNSGMLFGINNGNFQFAFGTSAWAGNTLTADTNRHVVYMNDENGDGRLDNTILASHSDVVSLSNNTKNIFIYAADGYSGGLTAIKVYSYKIYGNGILIRDFIPVLDSNNVACLLDQVENKFYYNAGTGTFTYGTAGTPVVADVARKIFSSGIEYRTSITNSVHKNAPAVVSTDNYILIAGGQTTDGSTPVKTVSAYDENLTLSQAADLPYTMSYSSSTYFNGYAIIAAGKIANSGSSRTGACSAYSNSLTRTALTAIYDTVYESSAAANTRHAMIFGGCTYNTESTQANSYDTNFTKTTPTSMSGTRRSWNAAAVGGYIVCCGGWGSSSTATDFYDNTNVKTTSTNPYSKVCDYPLGLSTNSYAIFFGGSTYENGANYAFKDCKAYDANKVLTSFNAPIAMYRAAGFSTGDYAFVGYNNNSYIYDDNLVLQSTQTNINCGNTTQGPQAAATKDFALLHNEWTTNIRVFDV